MGMIIETHWILFCIIVHKIRLQKFTVAECFVYLCTVLPLYRTGGTGGARKGAPCVQMDFMRTFETTTKCNNINHVWNHFYKILVVLKYHRRLWANIFDTNISRCINIYNKWCICPFLGYLCSYKCMCQRYWLIGVYGTSKLPKFYRNDFKHDLYCCIWC